MKRTLSAAEYSVPSTTALCSPRPMAQYDRLSQRRVSSWTSRWKPGTTGATEAARLAGTSGYSIAMPEIGSQDAPQSRHSPAVPAVREEGSPELGNSGWQRRSPSNAKQRNLEPQFQGFKAGASPTTSICSDTVEGGTSSRPVTRLSNAKDYLHTLTPAVKRRVPPGFKDVFSKVRKQDPLEGKKRAPKPMLGDGFDTCGSLPMGPNSGRRRRAAKIRVMGQLELTSERPEISMPEPSSNIPDGLARAVRKKQQEAIVFDFSSNALPPLPPKAIDGANRTSKRNAVKDVVNLDDRLTSFKDKRSRIPHTAAEVDDGARCSTTTQTNASKTVSAVQVQVADYQQDVTATTAVQPRLTAEELVAVTAPTTGGQTGLRIVERRDLRNLERRPMAEEPKWNTTDQKGLWRGSCYSKTRSNQPVVVHPLTEVSTPVALTYLGASSTGALSVPAPKGASPYKPGEPILHLELLTKTSMTRAGRVLSPSRPRGKGDMPSSALAKRSDECFGAKITHHAPRMAEFSLPPRSSYGMNVQTASNPREHTDVVPLGPANLNTNKPHALRISPAPTSKLDGLSDTEIVPENTMLGNSHNESFPTCQQIPPSLMGDEATKEPEQTEQAEMHLAERHQAKLNLSEIAQDNRALLRHVQRQDIGTQCPRSLISRTKSMLEPSATSREGYHFNSTGHNPSAEVSNLMLDDCYCNVEVPQTPFVPETQRRVQKPRIAGSQRAYSDYSGLCPFEHTGRAIGRDE